MTTETTIGTANVSTLTTLWSESLPAASVTSPMVVQDSAGTDLVYAGDASGTFFAYNAVTGAQVWIGQPRHQAHTRLAPRCTAGRSTYPPTPGPSMP